VPVDLEGTHRSQLGYLAQEPRFYGWMSGRQTIEYVMRFFPATPGRHRVDELLDLVGLADAADRPTGAYSGGMRQRLGIAQALAGDPAVVLLDEPAAALDPLGRHDVLALLERLRGTKTVFYSTHILDDVQRVSDHVAILDRGRLVTSAPTGELMRRATSGSVRVALVGDARDAATALADLPGVLSVNPAGRAGDEWRFDLHLGESLPEVVQRGVMGFAVDHDLIVTSNHQESADLESVFLKIVNEERAA